MRDRIRFHLDEPVDLAVARALRRHGIDVTTTPESGLRTASDKHQLEFASREGRVLVTHDADFLRLAAKGNRHHGIAYCHKASRSVGQMVRSLILMYEVLAPEEIRGRVEFL
ncbi:MAG: DUF5615 family PIN-like protein [Thermoanaerobaculia bacterium]